MFVLLQLRVFHRILLLATVPPRTGASASYDRDGKVVRYVWRKIDGQVMAPSKGNAVSTDGKAYVSQLWAAGTYRYEVKVIDDRAEWTSIPHQ